MLQAISESLRRQLLAQFLGIGKTRNVNWELAEW